MDENNNFTLSEDINGPLLAAVFGIEMVAGLITNSFVLILTACHFKTWKQPSTIFLTNMLLNNLISDIFVVPFAIITAASGEWVFGKTYNQKLTFCQFTAFMFWYCVTVITEGLVLLSFDRFFYIVKSFEYERHMNRKKAAMMVAISWILAAILSSPPLFGFGRYGFASSYGTCAPRWEGEPGYVVYILLVFLTFFCCIIVTSVWTLCYTQRYLKTERERLRLLELNTNTRHNNDVYSSRKMKLIGLFGMIMLIHLICYGPSVAAAFFEIVTTIPAQLYATLFVLFFLLSILSPLVQSFFRRDIRQTMLKLITWCRRVIKEKFNDKYARVSTTLQTNELQ